MNMKRKKVVGIKKFVQKNPSPKPNKALASNSNGGTVPKSPIASVVDLARSDMNMGGMSGDHGYHTQINGGCRGCTVGR